MGANRKTWRVEGVHCPRCEDAVCRALAGANGLNQIETNWQVGTVTALWEQSALPESAIDSRLRKAGYALRQTSACGQALGSLARLLGLLAGTAVLYLLAASTANSTPSPMPFRAMGNDCAHRAVAVRVATSLNCVAMCGGINLAQSAASAHRGGGISRSNLLYNQGRLISYALHRWRHRCAGYSIQYVEQHKGGDTAFCGRVHAGDGG